MNEIEVAYVRVEVPDVDGLGAFLTDVIGLAPGAVTTTGDRTWTDDAAVHRILVGAGPAADLTTIGVEATDDAAFDAVAERLAGGGWPAVEADAAHCAARRVRRLASIAAPWGSEVELVVGLERMPEPPELPLVPGGFLTEGQGFGHVVVATTAFEESVRFATEGLGMAQSDYIVSELAPGIELEVRFLHCNPRHHSLALARAPFELPQRLHHLMVETNDRDDVGRAFDRAMASGLPLPNGLGLHDNDRMFSFYVASPAGFQVEVGHGARQITEPWTDDRRYDRISAWGHQPVARDAPA